jgi:hypothetical protein
MANVIWPSCKHRTDATVWLDLTGDLRGAAAEPLAAALVQIIVVDQPDRLLVGSRRRRMPRACGPLGADRSG